MKKSCLLVMLMATAGGAHAGMCEDEFEVVGDARNGLMFSAAVKIPNLSIKSALGQLQAIAIKDGMQVGAPVIGGKRGEVQFIQAKNNPPVIVEAAATDTGFVTLETKLARGQKMDPTAGKTYMCGWLGQLKAGKAGEAMAAEGARAAGTDRVIEAEAVALSKQLGKEMRAAMSAVDTPSMKELLLGTTARRSERGDVAAAFAPMRAKYMGRRFRIDGQAYYVGHTEFAMSPKRTMEVSYLVTPTRGLLNVRQSADFNGNNFGLTCILAADQARFFARLQSNDWMKLEGTVSNIDEGSLTLTDCRQVSG